MAAGAGFSALRWIKTAENATDYSVMNTARQLLWLPTSREEKYKAKQAIDTFFVRAGDVLSAGVVYLGTQRLHLDVQQFAVGNIALTLVWLGVALWILRPQDTLPRMALRPLAPAAAAIALLLIASPALAQETREEQLAAQRADKSLHLQPYRPDALEARLRKVESTLSMFGREGLYPFVGSAMKGGGVAFGPGYRRRYSDTGIFDVHGAWSVRNFKAADASLMLPALADGRVRVTFGASRVDAPRLAFYGTGMNRTATARTSATPRRPSVSRPPFRRRGCLPSAAGSIRCEWKQNWLEWRSIPLTAGADSLPRSTLVPHRAIRDAADSIASTGRIIDRQTAAASSVERTPRCSSFSRSCARTGSSRCARSRPRRRPPPAMTCRYFLMPDLGGSEMLRGYPSWRFRDRNRLLLTGDIRWTAGPFVDMALFLDAGQVAPRAADFDWGGFRKTYGIGLTLHTLTTVRDAHRSRADASGKQHRLLVEPELLKSSTLRQPSTHEDPSMTPLSMRKSAAALVAASVLTLSAIGTAATSRFFDDDPMWVERDTQDASGMKPMEISLFVDLTSNALKGTDPETGVRAQNLNSVDEVPDSSWFTNRAGQRRLTAEEVEARARYERRTCSRYLDRQFVEERRGHAWIHDQGREWRAVVSEIRSAWLSRDVDRDRGDRDETDVGTRLQRSGEPHCLRAPLAARRRRRCDVHTARRQTPHDAPR